MSDIFDLNTYAPEDHDYVRQSHADMHGWQQQHITDCVDIVTASEEVVTEPEFAWFLYQHDLNVSEYRMMILVAERADQLREIMAANVEADVYNEVLKLDMH